MWHKVCAILISLLHVNFQRVNLVASIHIKRYYQGQPKVISVLSKTSAYNPTLHDQPNNLT